MELLKEILPQDCVAENENMSKHVSFRTGGAAKVFVTPRNSGDIKEIISALQSAGEEYTVIGKGSNLLVSDLGYDGVIICIGKNMSDIQTDGCRITAQSGALLSAVAMTALKNSLTGFEFASGIPGSLGGAIVMNAGAYGGEMKDVVVSTEYISPDGNIRTVSGNRHGFGYRQSMFGKDDIVLSSVIELSRGDKVQIRDKMRELNGRRREKQPLEYPSAGSTFKRPQGYFAAKLIDDAGLRGYRLGGAAVSDKHCGFIINRDNATSSDIYNLMKHVQKTVSDKFKVTLEPEVRMIGVF